LIVGASLSVDYTLTVAVSISAGTAAITSASVLPFYLEDMKKNNKNKVSSTPATPKPKKGS
jgi:hypothetical protein